MRVYLLRPGATAYNEERRYLGRSDLPLSPGGRAALTRADFSPRTVYVSPLRRAAETAELLFPEAGLHPISDLREMDFGLFEGKTYREMADWPAYRAWVEGGCLDAVPGGESKADFCHRTCAAFALLVDRALEAEEDYLVVVAHGGTQMAALERFVLPRGDYFSWQSPCGCGFALDAALWRRDRKLSLLERVCYTEGGEPWQ